MNATDFKPWMESAVGEVLEAMCFLSTEGDAAANENTHCGLDWVCARLEFEGNPNGAFGIAVPPETASTIACNFLGEEQSDIDDAQRDEVICELTNMVCGTLLAQLESRQTFTLSKPRRDAKGVWSTTSENSISAMFTLDEGLLYAWLTIGKFQ